MSRIRESVRRELDFRWGFNNSKMEATERQKGRRVVSFDLLAGTTCPAASICQSWAQPDGTVKLGKHAEFVCYAAKTEAHYRTSYNAHKHNLDLVLEMLREDDGVTRLADMLVRDLTLIDAGIVRIHSSGDLFNARYAQAWIEVARRMPDVLFFGYTKVYASFRLMTDVRLPNLGFAFSMGSRDDRFVKPGDVTCTVVTGAQPLSADGKQFFFVLVDNPGTENATARFTQWQDIICGNHDSDEDYSRDFDYIMAGKSFGIGLH